MPLALNVRSVAAALTALLPAAALAQCFPAWSPGFGATGVNGTVNAFFVFDDGTGEALYAGGQFTTAGGISALNVARWDGTSWEPLSSGLVGTVRAFAAFDPDGPGPDPTLLFAGGDLPGYFGAWDGSQWLPIDGYPEGTVRALSVFDDGSGPALYTGGDFLDAGGESAAHIARWDGETWTSLGSGIAGNVYALAVYDDGNGEALYAGGIFTKAGGNDANRIARWDGLDWSALGAGTSGAVTALAVYDDGSGPGLYAGGLFNKAGGNDASRIARWNGSQWLALMGGVSDIVYSLSVHDDGSGPALFVGGQFTQADGDPAAHIARWKSPDVGWSALEGGADNNVLALATFEDAQGSTLIAGGNFVEADGGVVDHVGQWRQDAWSGLGAAVDASIRALASFDDGSGQAIYAGGLFLNAGGVEMTHVGRWNGTFWAPLGAGLDKNAYAIATFDDGSGEALYAGGVFTAAGVKSVSRIARWNGSVWSALGAGVDGTVHAMRAFNDGSGEALYAAGDFLNAGETDASRISRWNGFEWSKLGGGLSGGAGTVQALEVFDDGAGPALYAAGQFTLAGGNDASRIAKWNGLSWSPLGAGVNNSVFALATLDDGSGPALYAAGQFTSAGGDAVGRIARWDGLDWSPLGAGLSGIVRALIVHDDGSGPALYAAGEFTQAGGKPANRIAKWDGLQWSALDSGINGAVFALASHVEGDQSALFAGGSFATAGDISSANIARWACQAPPVDQCELPELLAPGGQTGDFFGQCISISGDTLIAGAFGVDTAGEDAGAAYIFTNSGGRWNYAQTLIPDDAIAGDFFGTSAAISGDLAIVGTPRADPAGSSSGAVYAYRRSGGTWVPDGKLVPDDAAPLDQFGYSVALLGDTALIGARRADLPGQVNAGAVYIFTRELGAWVQTVKLTAPDGAANDELGYSVALGPNVAVAGAPTADGEGGIDSGAAYAFFHIGDQWGYWTRLEPDDLDAGDRFGASLAADQHRIMIGAPGSDRLASDAGAAYVYRASLGQWMKEAVLHPVGSNAGDAAGTAVAFSGTQALVGSVFSDAQGEASGAATLYTRAGIDWFELIKLTGDGVGPGDALGSSVAIGPGVLASGVLFADGPGGDSQGALLLYSTDGCPCYADFTGDAKLDLFDFLNYVNAFNAGQPAADCDASGALDLFDFLCYTNAFNTGC